MKNGDKVVTPEGWNGYVSQALGTVVLVILPQPRNGDGSFKPPLVPMSKMYYVKDGKLTLTDPAAEELAFAKRISTDRARAATENLLRARDAEAKLRVLARSAEMRLLELGVLPIDETA